MIKTNEDLVEKIFKATNNFPLKSDSECLEGEYVKPGELLKVTKYDSDSKEFTILNLSLKDPNAWFKVDKNELNSLII